LITVRLLASNLVLSGGQGLHKNERKSEQRVATRQRLPAESQKTARIRMVLNGEEVDVSFAPYKTLLEVLREDLNHMGTKHGCELGECGACSVLLDGEPVLSCLVLALECDGRDVITIEGLASDGELHPLQEAFAKLGGSQCGYCTPGMIITAKALLDRVPHPSHDQIREALSGNLCRCTGYLQIFDSVEAAITEISERKRTSEVK
jgi:aerobic-type carbon monoxide dehydrogenase small subunit (CoxS/CutS family)